MVWAPIIMGAVGAAGGIIGNKKAQKEADAAARQAEQARAQWEGNTAGLRSALQDQINGGGNSAAEQQMRRGIEQSNQQVVGAGATGGPLAMRFALQSAQRANQETAGQAASLRSAEQAQAIQQMQGLAGQDYDIYRNVLAAQAAADANPSWWQAGLSGAANGVMGGMGMMGSSGGGGGAAATQSAAMPSAGAQYAAYQGYNPQQFQLGEQSLQSGETDYAEVLRKMREQGVL